MGVSPVGVEVLEAHAGFAVEENHEADAIGGRHGRWQVCYSLLHDLLQNRRHNVLLNSFLIASELRVVSASS